MKNMTIAIIRVRGVHGLRHEVARALTQLHLTRKNHCILIEGDAPWIRNTLSKIKDYVTWGEIAPEALKALQEKRKPEFHSDRNGVKFWLYRLNNPTGGWKGIKMHYPQGDLGNRKEKIGDLLVKMLH